MPSSTCRDKVSNNGQTSMLHARITRRAICAGSRRTMSAELLSTSGQLYKNHIWKYCTSCRTTLKVTQGDWPAFAASWQAVYTAKHYMSLHLYLAIFVRRKSAACISIWCIFQVLTFYADKVVVMGTFKKISICI